MYNLLLVAMAVPYTPASWVINLPGALGSYFQPIRFVSQVYFILKLLTFHTFCVEQLLSTLHASLSRSICMCHLVTSWQSMLMTSNDWAWLAVYAMFMQERNGGYEIIKQEIPGSGHSLLNTTCFAAAQCCNNLKRFRASVYSLQHSILHSAATANSDDVFRK